MKTPQTQFTGERCIALFLRFIMRMKKKINYLRKSTLVPKLRIFLRAVKLEGTLQQAKQINWAQNTYRMRRKKLPKVFQKYLKTAYHTDEETEEDLGREQTTRRMRTEQANTIPTPS
jgi:hypothetical protein